jgi:serine phosphatase RsbU (regulator of sigma subunit)
VGDVAGKGMPAALLMARLSSEVGLLLQADPDPARVVGQLNRGLCAARIGDRFITLLLVLVDGDRQEWAAVSAGHMAPLVRRSDGRIEEVGKAEAGVPLGLTEGTAYEPVRGSLGPGDVMVLYTDGVTDAEDPDGRRFDPGRLREALASAPGGAPSVGEAVLGAVRRHAAGRAQVDDMTLVCFGRA